jgi:hypothetical protein
MGAAFGAWFWAPRTIKFGEEYTVCLTKFSDKCLTRDQAVALANLILLEVR